MKIIQKLWNAAGLPCRECRGAGYVVASDIAEFIDRYGLSMYQAAITLMDNEIHYGCLGSLPCEAWEDLGMSDEHIAEFLEVAHSYPLLSCPSCHGQPNHPDALGAATAIIDKWSERRRRQRAEWEAKRTPQDRQRKRRSAMAVAIRYAETSRKPLAEALAEEAAE